MKTLGLARLTATALLATAFTAPAIADDISDRALALAGQQKFDQALTLLSQQNTALQNSYEHRFAKARILS